MLVFYTLVFYTLATRWPLSLSLSPLVQPSRQLSIVLLAMSESLMRPPRVYLEEIEIRARSTESGVQQNDPALVTLSLQVDGNIVKEKENWGWDNLIWLLEPPIEIGADDKVSVETLPELSATIDPEVLAVVTFEDLVALDITRNRNDRAQLKQEHKLATITVYFSVDKSHEQSHEKSAETDIMRTIRQYDLAYRSPSEARVVWSPPASRCTFSMDVPVIKEIPIMHRSFVVEFHDLTEAGSSKSPPVDGGRIQYAAVGTTRPKPR
ncbi:hypothetical protein AB1N83_006518 [Pleurotus pulmonarius]